MTNPASTTSRILRLALAAVPALALLAGGPAAGATSTKSSSGGSSSEATLQIQAQELAGEIQAEGQNLDQLAASYETAQLRNSQLARQITTLKRQIAAGAAEVVAARNDLRQQALLAYLTGGGPLITGVPNSPTDDPSLTIAYAEIIAGGEHEAVDAYRAALQSHIDDEASLTAARAQTAATLARIASDQAAANQAMATRQAALAQVKGHLAVLVAQVQAQQEAAVKASLSARHDLPPSAPVVRPTSSPRTHRPITVRVVATTSTVATTPTTTPAPTSTESPTTDPPTTESPPTTDPPPPPHNQPAPGYRLAIAFAYKQLGKPYQWGADGPNSYDCSGLTMKSWAAAGVSIPRVAQDQYDATTRIPISYLMPGDLVFFGTDGSDITHVGIYIGGGEMIDAPETGQDVSIQSIYWSDLVDGGRVQE